MDQLLKMLRITSPPAAAAVDHDTTQEVEDLPEDRASELPATFKRESLPQRSAATSGMQRRESLLTRGLQGRVEAGLVSPPPNVPRGMSTTSSHSFASTAELTSDAESLLRSASPSPPPFTHQIRLMSPSKPVHPSSVRIADISKEDQTTTTESGEAAIEKTLGRKRCIMFACNEAPSVTATPAPVAATANSSQTSNVKKQEDQSKPAPRKSMLTFACPTRPAQSPGRKSSQTRVPPRRLSSPKATRRHAPSPSPMASAKNTSPPQRAEMSEPSATALAPTTLPKSPTHTFHEFGSSHDETAEWVDKADELTKPKLTIDDLLKKEHAIRRIGKEAEEEADEEERALDYHGDEFDDDEDADEDDFAPSDDEEDEEEDSDDGNESDNEAGFAESESESEAESEYQFWAPSATSTRATSTDNMTHFSLRQASRSQRSRTSSTSSAQSSLQASVPQLTPAKHKATKAIKMRPGTPELPDSTDFVCGTLDEDRPLEAAYWSCREQRRLQKHVPIPQDIDPSFPTTDPEDEGDDDLAESSDQVWMKHQFDDFTRDGQPKTKPRRSPLHSPTPMIAPPRTGRPAVAVRATKHSPPPKVMGRSPVPRRLFDLVPKRLRSPPPNGRLRSPRGSPINAKMTPFGITINHLAQRPNTEKTSSLPHTPNPFFRNWSSNNQTPSRITSEAVSPADETVRSDIHVRGPVDIVIGLEKKRQKRKEKYWRTHCRKAAKEAEKRPPPGRGVERMKELGLECAERNRGYGLGQQAQLVLSL